MDYEGWKYVMEVFFPEQGYKHAGTPDFERTVKEICIALTMRWSYGFRL